MKKLWMLFLLVLIFWIILGWKIQFLGLTFNPRNFEFFVVVAIVVFVSVILFSKEGG